MRPIASKRLLAVRKNVVLRSPNILGPPECGAGFIWTGRVVAGSRLLGYAGVVVGWQSSLACPPSWSTPGEEAGMG